MMQPPAPTVAFPTGKIVQTSTCLLSIKKDTRTSVQALSANVTVAVIKRKMSLRICTSPFEHMLELSGDERKFKGLFAPAYGYLVDNVWRFFPNASLTSSNKLGDMDPETMMFDGCLGRLQRNESDVMVPVALFPLLGKGLNHGTTSSSSKVSMASAYNNTAVPLDTDVMDAFHSFTDQLWSLTILTAAILTVVVFFIFRVKLLFLPESKTASVQELRLIRKQRTRQCFHQALLIMTANVLKQHTSYNIRGILLRRHLILLLFSVFSFLMINYFSSMIKTEMVVQKRPETISSYEDLMAKPNIKPLWARALNVHWNFMNANKNTTEGRIWERAKAMGVDSCFLKSQADIQQNIGRISRQEAVLFSPNNLINVLITNACAFSRTNGLHTDVNTWVRSDENARETLEVLMQSAALSPDSVKKFNHIIKAEFEHHVLYKSLKTMEFSIFPDTGSKAMRDCVANKIVYPEYDIEAIHLRHYLRLFFITGSACLSCLLVLSFELMLHMYHKFCSHIRNRKVHARTL